MSLVTPSSDRTARQAHADPVDLSDDSLEATGGLKVDVQTEGNHGIITVTGEIDLATAPELSEAIRHLLYTASRIVIDLDQVSFIDSTGLSVLVATYRRMTTEGGSMALVCNNASCMRVMQMTGLSRLFTFYASTAAATGAC